MSQTRKVRAAAVQIAPDLTSGAATLDRVIAAIDEAAGNGAEFIVFPETFVPWYPYFSFVTPPVQSGAERIRLYEHAIAAPGPETDRVAAAARKHGAVVVLGINERDHGSLYNTQLVFDADGALKLKRRKITPTFHERMTGARATARARCGRHRRRTRGRPRLLGALQPARSLCADGAARGDPRGAVSRLAGRPDLRRADRGDDPPSRARSGCFVVNATGWLAEAQIASITPNEALRRGLRGGCMTAIVSPEGRHLVPPLTEGEGVLVADLDLPSSSSASG